MKEGSLKVARQKENLDALKQLKTSLRKDMDYHYHRYEMKAKPEISPLDSSITHNVQTANTQTMTAE